VLVGPCPVISADREMVGLLVRELLANAIRTRSGDRPLQIRIACAAHRVSGATFCTVRDNGVGFDRNLALKMFEPFVGQLHAGPVDAASLRLATCKAVCERHGWAIWAERADEQGSVFTIRIPDTRLVARRPLSRISARRRALRDAAPR
jgi:light-regulated signal transduction histidine kinase (bacteriophytochrome)